MHFYLHTNVLGKKGRSLLEYKGYVLIPTEPEYPVPRVGDTIMYEGKEYVVEEVKWNLSEPFQIELIC